MRQVFVRLARLDLALDGARAENSAGARFLAAGFDSLAASRAWARALRAPSPADFAAATRAPASVRKPRPRRTRGLPAAGAPAVLAGGGAGSLPCAAALP